MVLHHRARCERGSHPAVTVHARSQRMNRAIHPLSQAREGNKTASVTTGTVKIRVENTSTNEPSEAEKIGALAEHGGVGWAIDNRRLVRAATAILLDH